METKTETKIENDGSGHERLGMKKVLKLEDHLGVKKVLKLEDYHICYSYDNLGGNKADYDYKDICLFQQEEQEYLKSCGKDVVFFSKKNYEIYYSALGRVNVESIYTNV